MPLINKLKLLWILKVKFEGASFFVKKLAPLCSFSSAFSAVKCIIDNPAGGELGDLRASPFPP